MAKFQKKNRFTMLMILMILMCCSKYEASAANIVSGFPLPVTGTPYYVTVLNKYSSGGEHSSYINKYVLGKSTAPNDIVADIAASSGTSVYAVAAGTVITSTFSNGGGNYIVIKHNDGTYSYYGHLSSRAVSKGNSVSQGQTIGYVGMTGSATGYHLHFEWSGHDPYCEFASKGYVQIHPNSGASVYPHTHAVPTTPSTADISFINVRAENISKDDAKIIGTINNPASAKVTRVHVTVQEGGTGEVWNYTEDCGLTKSSFNLWYNLKSEWRSLKEATTYYYSFKAEVNGQWYRSETYRFDTTDSTAPTISYVKVENITSTGYDVSCVANDNKGVVKVQFPTWTAYNGQDDLIWHDASYSNSRWSFHVNIADHNNESGKYITHIYAWDEDGNSSSSGIEVDVPTPRIAPTSVNLEIDPESQATAIITANVSPSNAEVNSVTWSSSDSQVAVVAKDPSNQLRARMVGLSTGNCTITVSINNGEAKKSITVRVDVVDSSDSNQQAEDEPSRDNDSSNQKQDTDSDNNTKTDKENNSKDDNKEDEVDSDIVPTVGDKAEIEGLTYRILNNNEVEVVSDDNYASKALVIPNTVFIGNTEFEVTSISKAAFKGNNTITSVEIGNNIETIGDEAFRNCKVLKKVTIGEGVTKIGGKAFYNCKKLKTINIQSLHISRISKKAFSGTHKKAKIILPFSKYKKYKKMIKKAGAPSKAKYLYS